ncbi:MAG: DUF3524 domain-containing protein, partial [Pirellulaceae bacterium]
MRILAIEPYYGGSHQLFLDQWIRRGRHHWQLLTLPAHHWKWRMRHAGIWCAREVRRLLDAGAGWDLLFCSDMLDLAQFLGLADTRVSALPRVVYFHENQLTYPARFTGERDLHFAMTNLTTALAATQVWFNSEFHRRSFLEAARAWLAKMPDYVPRTELAEIQRKSQVQSPGVDVTGHRSLPTAPPLHIAWAARWEHDKNPETFFDALRLLQQQHIDFRLTVCGQDFHDAPPAFAAARQDLAAYIEHWGPLPAREEYLNRLGQADVFVSTALHEFFGLAVMEAIAMGLFPLLPRRLSYPELLGLEHDAIAASFFHDGSATHLAQRLVELARAPQLLHGPRQRELLNRSARRYDWSRRAA